MESKIEVVVTRTKRNVENGVAKQSKFYTFSQNNSGGWFHTDDDLDRYVVVEAYSTEDANARAQTFGVYFNGCDDDIDCVCCGDRWYEFKEWGGKYDGANEPKIYDKPVKEHLESDRWSFRNKIIVHYLDGTRETYEVKENEKS